MEKKKLYGSSLKEQYLASARDKRHSFVLAGGAVRGVILHGTRMVNEMRANHELGVMETLVLGRAYLGASLMAADLKGANRLAVRIDCTGPIKGLIVEANAYGEVRGYLRQVPIPLEKPMENFDLSPFFGAGLLSVTKYLEEAKQPFTGQIELRYGNVAQDLAHYYLTSEQIPTAVNLGIKFDREGEVAGAGGLMLQAMPRADATLTAELEGEVLGFPSLGEEFLAEKDPEELVREVFRKYAPRFLASRRVEFMCHCNRERLRGLLAMLPVEDLRDMRDKGPHPVQMCCHNCGTPYEFSRQEIAELCGSRTPNN
jgi:molecular chaperone Hsp33